MIFCLLPIVTALREEKNSKKRIGLVEGLFTTLFLRAERAQISHLCDLPILLFSVPSSSCIWRDSVCVSFTSPLLQLLCMDATVTRIIANCSLFLRFVSFCFAHLHLLVLPVAAAVFVVVVAAAVMRRNEEKGNRN